LLEALAKSFRAWTGPDAFVGTNVFVLFDTSNFMYKGFVYAEDAIARFRAAAGPGRFGRGLYVQPQSLRAPPRLTASMPRPSRVAQRPSPATTPRCITPLLAHMRDAAKVPGRRW
jgi:hypothetical protein